MPVGKKKTVEVNFVDDESVHHSINIDQSAEEEPVAGRTRYRTKISDSITCTPTSRSKSRPSTPVTLCTRNTPTTNPSSCRRSARIRQSVNPPRRELGESPVKTPRSRASTRLLSKGNEEPDTRKVTPLKIDSRKLLGIPSTSDDSSADEKTPDVINRSSFIEKLDLNDENVFRSSSSESNIKTTPCRSRTPKTPKYNTPLENSNTPKTGNAIRLKRGLQRTPVTSSVAKNLFTENSTAKTPRATRNKLKQKIQAKKYKEENYDSELAEDSDDDFEPDSSSEQTSESDRGGTPAKQSRTLSAKILPSPHPSGYGFRTHTRVDYNEMLSLNVDKYFEKKFVKSVVSKNALSSLPTPSITDSDVNEIVSKDYVKHDNELRMLTEKYIEQFDKWLFYLKEGFNLIMYGIGSKLQILKLFQKEKLNENYVLTINGFYPGFAITELFRVLMNDILEASHCPVNLNDALIAAREELEENEFPIFIIINSIDGIALRGSKQQNILSKVAELPNIHIIATVDHINAPLLWGNNRMSAFNFLWLDVTTFNAYSIETTFENSFDIGNLSSDSSLVALNKLFQPETAKTKDVFKLIVKHYLSNKNKKNYEGIPLSELMRLAKEKFVVTSQMALRVHLKKFVDHEIINMKDNYVKILINANILNTFCKQQFCNDDDD